MAGGWGGAREGAGRKPDGYEAPKEKRHFDAVRAEHEEVKLRERAFKLAIAQKEYLPRAVQQQAAATALSILTQSLRSLPDTLERVCNLTPEQADLAQQHVDAALAELAAAFQQMTLADG